MSDRFQEARERLLEAENRCERVSQGGAILGTELATRIEVVAVFRMLMAQNVALRAIMDELERPTELTVQPCNYPGQTREK